MMVSTLSKETKTGQKLNGPLRRTASRLRLERTGVKGEIRTSSPPAKRDLGGHGRKQRNRTAPKEKGRIHRSEIPYDQVVVGENHDRKKQTTTYY